MNRRRAVVATVGALAVVVLAAVGWFLYQAYPLGRPGSPVTVTVNSGDSIAVVAGRLQTEGVIGSAFAFRLETLVLGGLVVHPGEYTLDRHSSFSAVRAILSAPSVDVVPGLTLHEVALQVASIEGSGYAEQFLAAATTAAATSPFRPAGRLEGLIAPGWYQVPAGTTPRELLDEMTTRFTSVAASLGLTPTTRVHGLDAYHLIIAASIVEKEGYLVRNMANVARVIYNRLDVGMRLQMDSTVLYPLGMDGGTVTPAMLTVPSPYNTYLNAGLTPTPICTVSTSALTAVLHPTSTPASRHWIYFTLVKKDGTMAFSDTSAEQLANERLAASRGI